MITIICESENIYENFIKPILEENEAILIGWEERGDRYIYTYEIRGRIIRVIVKKVSEYYVSYVSPEETENNINRSAGS